MKKFLLFCLSAAFAVVANARKIWSNIEYDKGSKSITLSEKQG